MDDLIRRVQAFADREDLWSAGDRVLAAVSGGADSVALTWILHHLARAGRVQLAGLVHLHHHIRGDAADADAAFVTALGERLDVPVHIGHVDVPALARDSRVSLEVAGRRARLAWFEDARRAVHATAVAVAHTRSDQAETVLLRLTRGAGTRGLSGMAPRSGTRIRPLLDESRASLRAWLGERGETWREDATNDDVAIPRNRVRAIVMPALAAINPAAEAAVVRAVRGLAADAAVLDALADEAVVRLVRSVDRGLAIDAVGLAALPDALARRVIRHACETLDPSRAYAWEETSRVLAVDRPRLVGRLRVERIRGDVVLTNRGSRPADGPAEVPTLSLPVPGTVQHPAGWWSIEAQGPMPPSQAPPPGPSRAVLAAPALGRHLTIRAWRHGDRVQPLGTAGRKKVQDVFVDRKVPRHERSEVPLVIDAQGRIAWVAGHVIGEAFRVSASTDAVVVLTLRR